MSYADLQKPPKRFKSSQEQTSEKVFLVKYNGKTFFFKLYSDDIETFFDYLSRAICVKPQLLKSFSLDMEGYRITVPKTMPCFKEWFEQLGITTKLYVNNEDMLNSTDFLVSPVALVTTSNSYVTIDALNRSVKQVLGSEHWNDQATELFSHHQYALCKFDHLREAFELIEGIGRGLALLTPFRVLAKCNSFITLAKFLDLGKYWTHLSTCINCGSELSQRWNAWRDNNFVSRNELPVLNAEPNTDLASQLTQTPRIIRDIPVGTDALGYWSSFTRLNKLVSPRHITTQHSFAVTLSALRRAMGAKNAQDDWATTPDFKDYSRAVFELTGTSAYLLLSGQRRKKCPSRSIRDDNMGFPPIKTQQNWNDLPPLYESGHTYPPHRHLDLYTSPLWITFIILICKPIYNLTYIRCKRCGDIYCSRNNSS